MTESLRKTHMSYCIEVERRWKSSCWFCTIICRHATLVRHEAREIKASAETFTEEGETLQYFCHVYDMSLGHLRCLLMTEFESK